MSETQPYFEPRGMAPMKSARPSRAWLPLIMVPVIWAIPSVVFMGLVAGVTGLAFIPFGWMYGPVVALFVAFALQRAIAERRRQNGEIILNYLESAVRLNLPLTPYLIAAEQSERGTRRMQIRALRQELSAGMPVSSALSVLRDVPEESSAMVAAHEPLGQLRVALWKLTAQARREEQDRSARDANRPFYRFYAIYLLSFSFLALVAFPLMGAAKFQEIVKDFKITRLNRLSTAVFRVSEFMNDYPIVPIVLIGLGVLAFLIPMSFYLHRLFVPGARRPRFTTAWPWLAWRLPVLHGAQVDKAMAEVCGLLAEATRAGTPLPVAVRQAMVLPINIGFKEKLGVFLEGLNQGKSAADAAAKARLPELLVGMLQPMSEASVGVSGAAMFEFLERYYRQRFSRTILMLRAAMEPLLVLLFGAIVLGMVLAVLQPVRQILESVMANGAGGVL